MNFGEGWVDWTERHQYESIDGKQQKQQQQQQQQQRHVNHEKQDGEERRGSSRASLDSNSKPSQNRSFRASLFLGGLVGIAGAALWIADRTTGYTLLSSSPAFSNLHERVPDAEALVLVSNLRYEDGGDSSGQDLYPWDHLAEPHRESRMEVVKWPGSMDDDAGVLYRWEVEGSVVGVGASIINVFANPGVYKCSVTSYYENAGSSAKQGGVTGSRPNRTLLGKPLIGSNDHDASSREHELRFEFDVNVKYTRREIRSMTDRDRETFFNAVSVIQRVPTSIGRKLYGDKYYSKDYFNRIHLYYGGDKSCDHWHTGHGFVTSHIGLSLMYEQSLQAVNPSIALPYWDFTVEGTEFDWSNFRSSSVFSDDWFGKAAPKNALQTPNQGRFGYVPVMLDATDFSVIYNPQGFLRAPWNSDNTPFLTRSDEMFGFKNDRKPSGCKSYRDAIRQTSWMDLAFAFNSGAHGHIHELLGGLWVPVAENLIERSNRIIAPFTHQVGSLVKDLWRLDYLVCPEQCALKDTWEECMCVCQPEAFEGKTAGEILEDSRVIYDGNFYDKDYVLIPSLMDDEGHVFRAIPGYTEEETDAIYIEMIRVMCTPIRMGSHYEASSTNDMTFWVLHPTIDRLWHLSRLEMKEDFDETWASTARCYGHNPSDIQPLHNMFLTDSTPSKKWDSSTISPIKTYYTNLELYQNLNPDSLDLPYIYDNFQWRHCEAEGIHIHV